MEEYEKEKLTVLVESDQVSELNKKVMDGKFKNISHAVRAAIRIYNQYENILEKIEQLQSISHELGLKSMEQLPAYVADLKKSVENLSEENRELIETVDSNQELLSIYRKLEVERDARKRLEEEIKP